MPCKIETGKLSWKFSKTEEHDIHCFLFVLLHCAYFCILKDHIILEMEKPIENILGHSRNATWGQKMGSEDEDSRPQSAAP